MTNAELIQKVQELERRIKELENKALSAYGKPIDATSSYTSVPAIECSHTIYNLQ